MAEQLETRRHARRSMNLVADLGEGRVAIRGREPSLSLELRLVWIVGDGPDPYPLVSLQGHAGATVPQLGVYGVEALVDELVALLPAMERER